MPKQFSHKPYHGIPPEDKEQPYGVTYGGWVNTEDLYQDQAPEVVMSKLCHSIHRIFIPISDNYQSD